MALRGERGERRRARAIGLGAVLCSWSVAFGLMPADASASRHFEKVSPAEKGLGDVVGDGATTVASRFGEAVAFSSRTPFGDTVGSGVSGQTQYVARRTDEAWVVHAITPTPRPDARQTFFASTRLEMYSDDLRAAIVRAYDLPAVTDDTPLRNNIYVEDTATRVFDPITVSLVDTPAITDFLNYPFGGFWGFSADARHVAFVTPTQFLLDAAPGVPNVYKWDDAVLSVASVLPDGNVAANGADTPVNLRSAMSADGSRLLFTASTSGNRQLYLEIDGRRTARVSEPELDPPPDPALDPVNVQPVGMTPDGRNVFFTTDTDLIPEDGNNATDLYRYTDSDDPSNPNQRNLTLISEGDISDLIGMSDDGERVYYRAAGVPTLWDHGVRSPVINSAFALEDFGLTANPRLGRVSPDGVFLAFVTSFTDDGVHGLTGEVTNGRREMYLSSLRGGRPRLSCVSCPPGSATVDVTVLPAVTDGAPRVRNAGFRPRYLSDAGHVFFSTADALVPEDTNGVSDTYEFNPATGKSSLLSTGQGSDPAMFADASASGDDVFIVTRQRLVATDRDDLVDLYDVRDGSSLPQVVQPPTPPACQGEGCQPPPSVGPSEGLLGSLGFEDGGTGAGGFRLFAVRQRIVRGRNGLLTVELFAPGRLTWSGRGLRAGAIRRGRAGRYGAPLRLRRRAHAHLRATGTYSTSVHFMFVSVRGDEAERTTRVTFRVAARKGR